MNQYHDYTEADTREELINPALVSAGWGKISGSMKNLVAKTSLMYNLVLKTSSVPLLEEKK